MSKQITHNGHLIVEVPKTVKDPKIVGNSSSRCLRDIDDAHGGWWHSDPLPTGTHTLIADSDSVSEEVAGRIMPHYKGQLDKFPFYENGVALAGYWCEYATYSLHSLLRAHSIERAVILKIEEL